MNAMPTLTRIAATGVTAATLSLGLLVPGAFAASQVVPMTIDAHTLEAKAPASFTPGEGIALWYNMPDGSAVPFGSTTALDDGSLDWQISADDFGTIPATAVNLVANGVQSNEEAVFSFDHSVVVPVAMVINAQTLEVTAPANFYAHEAVALWYNLPDGTPVSFGSTVAQADGSLDWVIDADTYATLPADAVNIVAQGVDSQHQAIAVVTH